MQAESNPAKTRYLLLPLFGAPHPDPEVFGWGTLFGVSVLRFWVTSSELMGT